MQALRVFFAIDLPQETKNIFREFLSHLQSLHPHENIRWSNPNHLHITLQFLKAVKPEDIVALTENIRTQLAQFPSFTLELGPLELFASRILSVVVGPHQTLSQLSHLIGQGILASGYDIEQRPFREHLTLAKLNAPLSFDSTSFPKIKTIFVREISLFQSKPSAQGSQYVKIWNFHLLS